MDGNVEACRNLIGLSHSVSTLMTFRSVPRQVHSRSEEEGQSMASACETRTNPR